ncbi:peptidoglycan DD-metalloendopeptidase family protein [Tomitella gaofuii]|uniref:peptidoglycan DD-metalloendopeptidase family protein n=1 Tax=Tomitella gaofuii TaxID=2760083 RepID=UPI0015FB6A87|nr:M23 family metallopeptidase [Tomitella gaofuii]
MNDTGKLAAAAAAVVLLPVLLIVVVILPATDEAVPCAPGTPQGPSASTPLAPRGSVVKPVDPSMVTVSSGFEPPDRPNHEGIDLAGDPGTPIYAYADGIVAAAGPASGFGQWIVLDHNIGGQIVSTVYGHMYPDGVLVSAGEKVRAGQHIANIGSNGQSSGPHLHFEYWPGSRLGGGHPVDPAPLYAAAPAPGDAVAAPDGPPASPAPGAAPAAPGEQLPPLPARMGSEDHWQVDTIRLARAVAARWPQLDTIGGWRPYDPYPDHPSGRAADIMIPAWDTTEGIALGDQINSWVLANAQQLNVQYTVWRGTYYPAGSPPQPYTEGNGSPTSEHMDHVHITTAGGGYPAGAPIRAPAQLASVSSATPGSPHGDCGAAADTGPGGAVAPGTVPEGWARWFNLSARQCPQISPSLLAAQVSAESGFRTEAVSGTGAQGISQFMPATWAAYGAKVDETGQVVGPPGSGDPSDPGDAIMAQGRYMCVIADQIDAWIDQGTVTAPNGPAELYLAAYNAGEGAVLASGGFPTGSPDYVVQTRPYVDSILAAEPSFRGQV